jgi:hypothetical protein
MNRIAQGSIEYLLIIGAALLVVAIVIVSMTSITSSGKSSTSDSRSIIEDSFDNLRKMDFDVIDAARFGFSTASPNNYYALNEMARYLSNRTRVRVIFAPGTYTITFPRQGDVNYGGAGQSACWINGASNIILDAGNSEFYVTNADINFFEQSVFKFSDSASVRINANFRGEHTGIITNGVKAVYLYSNNSNFTIVENSVRMYDGVRIGQYEDPINNPIPVSEGNHDINVVITSTDTYYTVAMYLAENVSVVSDAKGTSEGNYGAHRAVYVTGSNNVDVVSLSRNMNVQDGCNIIGSAPAAIPPYHFGSTNINMRAIDTGTDEYLQYQTLVKINVVNSSKNSVSITHSDINVYVDVNSSSTLWRNNCTFEIGSGGSSASHRFENITVSGYNRRPGARSNDKPLICVDTLMEGLSYLQLKLDNLHDVFDAPTPYSIGVYSNKPEVHIDAYNSTLGNAYFVDPSKQFFTAH